MSGQHQYYGAGAARGLALVELEILPFGRCVDPGHGPDAVILAGEEAGDAYIKKRRRRHPRQDGEPGRLSTMAE
jgi:hypothetical protein